MKKPSFILFVVSLLCFSCSNDDSTTQEEDTAKLESIYNDIITYSKIETESCSNPAEWGFVKMFDSPCSATGGYILYSKKADQSVLEKKIEQYKAQKAYISKKWGFYADVSPPCIDKKVPTGVKCVDNKPQLYFDFVLY
ncbi:hypothetical protein [Flavobacterium luteolum]|uniref:hypothetical protein n=1 Tax=Flavobacterium luteolum TaxID=3003259 RepID=UPI00248D6CB0|nr:hypothetical protein [Flavobacterium luteolum]